MQRLIRQVVRESMNTSNKNFKGKDLDTHTYTEVLICEICRQARMCVAEDESTSHLQEVLAEHDEEVITPIEQESNEALTSINQERIEESTKEEETPTINQGLQEPDLPSRLPDIQRLMELSLDLEEHDELIVEIPYDKILL